jgi:hypothetical protein
MLPLVLPQSSRSFPNGRCWLRVANRRVYLQEGKVCLIYRVRVVTAYISVFSA